MVPGFQIARRQAEGYEAWSGVFMRPSAERIVAAAGLTSGDAVLDVACGTGLVARAAWPIVQPGGRVVGVDVNAAMLAVAGSLAGEWAIEWAESSAQKLRFEDATFTHVFCQQGFQFFPDGLAAAKEAHRVLRPGGLLVASVWATPGGNPYIETQLALLAELQPDVAASARAATPPLADALLRSLAFDAGFDEVAVSLLEHSVEVGDLKSYFLEQTATTPWASALSSRPREDQMSLAEVFVDRLRRCLTDSGDHLLPFASHMLVARA